MTQRSHPLLTPGRRATLLTLLTLCFALSVTATGLAGTRIGRGQCRQVCAVAIEHCVQLEAAALVDAGLSNKRLRRKTRKARRGCERRAFRRCKHEGETACGTPLSCQCKG